MKSNDLANNIVNSGVSWSPQGEHPMTNLSELPLNARRTRRNVVKMGAILTSAAVASLATVKDGAAKDKDKDKNKDGGDARCLMRGTTIKTADGDRKIEELAIGGICCRPCSAACAPFNGSHAIH